jgi:hypothetical protein
MKMQKVLSLYLTRAITRLLWLQKSLIVTMQCLAFAPLCPPLLYDLFWLYFCACARRNSSIFFLLTSLLVLSGLLTIAICDPDCLPCPTLPHHDHLFPVVENFPQRGFYPLVSNELLASPSPFPPQSFAVPQTPVQSAHSFSFPTSLLVLSGLPTIAICDPDCLPCPTLPHHDHLFPVVENFPQLRQGACLPFS